MGNRAPSRVPRSTGLLRGESHVDLDAAVLFVDIDGFTALTDQLGRHGRAAAELLHIALSQAHGPVLDRIDRAGGDVVHVVGDAVIGLFCGDGAVERAVATAGAAHRHLETVEVDGHRFGATSAIATGPVDLRALGHAGRQRQLVAVGAAVDSAMQLEHAAASGSIVVDQRVLREVGDLDGLIDGTVTPPKVPRSQIGLGDDAWLPEVLRRGRRVPAQHKYSHTSFVQVRVGERWADASRWFDELEARARADGVVLFEADPIVDGVRVRLVMGAPIASGSSQSALMALTCWAVEEAAQHGLEARAGICCGPTFVGSIVGRRVMRTVVIGDPVNVAARLAAAANPGRVLADHASVIGARVQPSESPEQRRLKGKSRPVDVVRLRTGDFEAPFEPPYVPRPAELAAIRGGLSDSRHGKVVVLVGQMGIGKTRLVNDLEAELTRAQLAGEAPDGSGPVIRVNSSETDTARPFDLVRRLVVALALRCGDPIPADAEELDGWCVRRGVDLGPWAASTAVALGYDVPQVEAFSLMSDRVAAVSQILAQVLASLEPARATTLIVEDAHSADLPSVRVLDAVVTSSSRSAASPSLLLSTRESFEEQRLVLHRGTQVRVERLSDDAIDMIAAGLGVEEARREVIVATAAGNPLHALSLAAHAESSDLEMLSIDLSDSIQHRLDTIGSMQAGVVDVVRAAAVLGNSARLDWVLKMLRRDRLSPSEVAAIRSFLRFDGDVVHFEHQGFREVVLNRIEQEGRRLHRHAVRVVRDATELSDPDRALLLGTHAAGSGDPVLVWRYERDAASAALERLAIEDALERLARAVEAGVVLQRAAAKVVSTALEAAGLAEQLGEYSRAEALTMSAAVSARSERQSTEVLVMELTLARIVGRMEDAERVVERRDRAVFRPQGRLRVDLLLAEASLRHRLGQWEPCKRVCLEVLRLRTATRWQRGRAMMLYDIASFDDDRTTRFVPEWKDVFGELGDLRQQANAFNNLAFNAHHFGDYDDAIRFNELAIEQFRKVGDIAGEATAISNIAEICWNRGDLDSTERFLAAAAPLWERAPELFGCAYLERNLGRLAARQGDLEEAWRRFDAAGTLFDQAGNPNEVFALRAARLEEEVRAGVDADRWGASLDGLEPARPGPEVPGIDDHVMFRLRAMIAERRGDRQTAHDAFVAAAVAAESVGAFEYALALLGAARTASDAVSADPYAAKANELVARMGVKRSGWITADLAGVLGDAH